jgi:hypothetical protein
VIGHHGLLSQPTRGGLSRRVPPCGTAPSITKVTRAARIATIETSGRAILASRRRAADVQQHSSTNGAVSTSFPFRFQIKHAATMAFTIKINTSASMSTTTRRSEVCATCSA